MRFYLSLGSNLGDPEAQVRQGVRAIDAVEGLRVTRVSKPFASAPMYVLDQPDFINLALIAESDREPAEVLAALQKVENEHGRQRGVRFGPRTLDIDIIAVDERVIDLPDLAVPHPRMHERSFVLVPLAEIAPDWKHPALGATAAQLRDALQDTPAPQEPQEPANPSAPAPPAATPARSTAHPSPLSRVNMP